jgi:hypothetical protein
MHRICPSAHAPPVQELTVTTQRAGRSLILPAIAFIVMAGAGYWFANWLFTGPAPPSRDGRDVTEPFLTAIREGRADEAWESTTAEFKSAEGRESFRVRARQPALQHELEFVSYEETEVSGLARGEATYRTASDVAPAAHVSLLLAVENGDWKVEWMSIAEK